MNGHDLTFQPPMSASIDIVSAKASDAVLLMDGMGTLASEFDPQRIPKWLANMPGTPATQQYLLRLDLAARRERQRAFTEQVCDEAKAILARGKQS